MSLERADKFKDLGNAKFKTGDFKGAIELYTKAIEENPNEASYYTNRSACYLQLKQFDNVIQDAKTATSKNPKFIKGYFRAAQALLMLGRTSDARRECSTALDIEKNNKEVTELVQKIDKIEKYLTTGLQQLSAGQMQEALNQFELALQLAPQSNQIALYKADALIGLKKFEEANILSENILKEDSNNAEACLIKGKAMYYMGNESGSRLVMRALQLSPEFPAANEFRKKIRRMETLKADGNSAFEKGQYQEAFEIYQKAIEIDTLNATINASLYCNRSACAMKMKNYALAEKEASKAIEIDPKYLKAYLRRGECLIQEQKYEEALRDFHEANQLDPSNNSIKQKLREVQKLVKQAKKKDYYKILEVDKNADEETIRKAYKKMAVKFHPDKFTDEEEKKKAEAQFKDIGEAYSILSDPQKKRRFDMGVDEDDMGGGGFDMGGVDPHDIFSMFMGGMGGGFGGFGGGEGVRFSSGGGFPGGSGRRGGGGHSFFFG